MVNVFSDVSWYHNGDELPKPGSMGAVLSQNFITSIQDITVANSGMYTCVATSNDEPDRNANVTVHVSSWLMLKVLGTATFSATFWQHERCTQFFVVIGFKGKVLVKIFKKLSCLS